MAKLRVACYNVCMNKPDRLLAPCGMDCSLCIGHQREKKKCSGCRATDGSQPKHCQSCGYAHCEFLVSGGYSYCFECEKFPCARLKAFSKRYGKWGMSLVQNLKDIQSMGEDAFLARQRGRWTCPKCGGLLCAHEDACQRCGHVWRVRE